MKIKKVVLGYWYQRTTLHLAEVVDFLRGKESPLKLDNAKLSHLREGLGIKSVITSLDELEYVEVSTQLGITIRTYEDGLVTLTKDFTEATEDLKMLDGYYINSLSPAISYLFSLGAPVPKELAGIKTPTPHFFIADGANSTSANELFAKLNKLSTVTIDDEKTKIFVADDVYVVDSDDESNAFNIVEQLIFVKEFKAQLHHYLNLHRQVWEEIADIKEKKAIRGKEVQELRNRLESYRKTIELIGGRIKQMSAYVETREELIQRGKWESIITDAVQFRVSNLDHTRDYVESLWDMTQEYVESAIDVFDEINNQSTKTSIQALTILSSIGVVNSVISFLETSKYPQITQTGVYYFAILLVGTYLLNKVINAGYRMVRYRISDIKISKGLK